MGLFMGLLLGSYDSLAPPVQIPGQPEPPKKSWQQEFKDSGAHHRGVGRTRSA